MNIAMTARACNATPEFWTGDALACLELVPSNSVDCVVTSPPYWGLRDYGVAGQIGVEPTMALYLSTMVAVCREVRRVLKPAGAFWLNVGDSYAANRGGTTPPAETLAGGRNGHGDDDSHRGRKDGYNPSRDPKGHGLKHKDLMMIPNRLAIALQDDGWWVRSEIIWHKPNPMPESVTDRPTSAHEKVWLLTKGERYFYDAAAIKESSSEVSIARVSQANFVNQTGGDKDYRNGVNASRSMRKTLENFAKDPSTRNARNVWTIPPATFRGAHFATFPPALVERCIKAGCPLGGLVLDPFGGAGTTGMVADRLGRRSLNFEINPEYVALAQARIAADRAARGVA